MRHLEVDWGKFLSRHDMVWHPLPTQWENAAFSGNGLLGFTAYKDRLRPRSIRFDIGRSDVTDHRENEGVTEGKCRLAIGKLELKTCGDIVDSHMRLSLWDAEIRIRLTTTEGTLTVCGLTHATENVILLDVAATGGETGFVWVWHPGLAVSPRKLQYDEPYEGGMNPFPIRRMEDDGVRVCVQPLLAGGEYATASQERGTQSGRTMCLSVGCDRQTGGGADEAKKNVRRAAARPFGEWQLSHRAWWHAFYAGDSDESGSFLSVPDARLEGFYWCQMYKLASATRADKPAIDLMGPWFSGGTPWPAIWWNLNIQLTYWPVLASNHPELGLSLCRMLDRGAENLRRNVPEEYRDDSAAIGRVSSYDCRSDVGEERCDLTWALHNYWLEYRYLMDDGMLRERLYPLLRRSVNYYRHLLIRGPDGQLHTPLSISPEYPRKAPDCNIDLSLIRWGCETLLAICRRLVINDPLIPEWKMVLRDLTDYPVDETGLMIGAGVPMTVSHRHYSHLLMIYPLGLLSAEHGDRALIEKSLHHWMGLKGAHRGYSYSGASAISSRLGYGEDARDYLHQLLEQRDFPITQNTMYREAGPVIETPLSAAASLQEMLLQSWGDVIRVFPAVPAAWSEVSFANMRAEGAFLVGAVRHGGKTREVWIQSLAGEPCAVRTDMADPQVTVEGCSISVRTDETGALHIPLKRGETAVVTPAGETAETAAGPTQPGPEGIYHFGSRPKGVDAE